MPFGRPIETSGLKDAQVVESFLGTGGVLEKTAKFGAQQISAAFCQLLADAASLREDLLPAALTRLGQLASVHVSFAKRGCPVTAPVRLIASNPI